MPVPKKRVGHSCQGHRRSNWRATVPTINFCPNCGAPKHTHTLCGACGFYKDRIVLERAIAEEPQEHSHDHDHDHEHDHGSPEAE